MLTSPPAVHNPPLQVKNFCSTGFGVHSTVDTRTYILTAGHCGSIGNYFENGQVSETIGRMTHQTIIHDDAMIETDSGTRYYDGPGIFNGDTHNSKAVAGEQPSRVGTQSVSPGHSLA